MSDHAQELARNASDLAERICALPETTARRHLAAIAGPPASGKSTLAEAVVAHLVDAGLDAVLMPMDGFHLDNRLLEPRLQVGAKGLLRVAQGDLAAGCEQQCAERGDAEHGGSI